MRYYLWAYFAFLAIAVLWTFFYKVKQIRLRR